MLGAPGEDGVFRYTPSPVEQDLPKPEDDSAEVAEWFNERGVTCFVLKYRVPRRPDAPEQGEVASALCEQDREGVRDDQHRECREALHAAPLGEHLEPVEGDHAGEERDRDERAGRAMLQA